MKVFTDEPVAFGRSIGLAREFAPAIMLTVRAGWRTAIGDNDMNASSDEVQITTKLVDGMREALKSRELPWGRELLVSRGTESRSRDDLSRPDGRTDISIYVRQKWDDHDPHAIVECKRISGNNARLCRLYVKEGIDRFKSGKYGRNRPFGFMAGYLIDGDANMAAKGINRYLSGQSRGQENLVPSNISRESWVWQSAHIRGAEYMEIHHALLPFD